MKLFVADYSWEVDRSRSNTSIVYTSLRAAKVDAIYQVKERMSELLQDAEKYDTDGPTDVLEVKISSEEATRISPSALAYIINNDGLGWAVVNTEKLLLKITLGPNFKKPVVEIMSPASR